MRTATLLMITLPLTVTTSWAQDRFTLETLPSGNQIDLQPQTDHHRVHVRLRVTGMSGRQGFARIGVSDSVGVPATSEATETFQLATDNDLWAIHLRVPRYASRRAVYTIYFGEYDPEVLDPYVAKAGFSWVIDRTPSGAATIKTEEDGQPFAVVYTVRRAIVQGGEIRIFRESHAKAPRGIRLGTVSNQQPIDGAQSSQRIN